MTAVPISLTPEDVILDVCRIDHVTLGEMLGKQGHPGQRPELRISISRTHACVRLRAMGLSISEIAERMHLHHSTVFNLLRASGEYRSLHLVPEGEYRKCPKGHAMTPENTYTYVVQPYKGRRGYNNRRCRECQYERQKERLREPSYVGEPMDPEDERPRPDACKACGSRLGYRTPRQLKYFETEQHMCMGASGWDRRYDGNVANGVTTGRVRR